MIYRGDFAVLLDAEPYRISQDSYTHQIWIKRSFEVDRADLIHDADLPGLAEIATEQMEVEARQQYGDRFVTVCQIGFGIV